ncbi:Uncharacterized membrane protein [Rhodovulum sp. ES.010]|uniref:DUF2177 family protein n=1 Tax=Rhodovulum sp. ES.010 TaxID=1882821 RepID=UPI000926C233|nr:DUF2177 family protein [Rhodovulum sp. ES.010]SIO01398.1 Uncharacterized membrane protein [Rhodovulum sp. ES.010]
MQIVTIGALYLVTAVVFLAVDAFMLKTVMRPLFERHVGDWLLENPRMGAAAAFYLAYVAGLVYLVSWPALQAGDPRQALIQGAIVGAMAYGTYEFTNWATLKNWSVVQVAVDTAWGTLLTAGSAWVGVMVARWIA